MQDNQDRQDVFVIPPNFIESGTFFGGMFKVRNVIEAGILALAVGVPVFNMDVTLTTKIVILCLTALPLAILGIVGIAGESLSSFALIFFRYLRNRRVVGKVDEDGAAVGKKGSRRKKAKKSVKKLQRKKNDTAEDDSSENSKKTYKKEKARKKPSRSSKRKGRGADEPEQRFLNPVAEYIPIKNIANGIIYTKDHRYVKIIEIEPINFLLRSAREQRNIIYSFISFLKISPVKLQFKVLTKRADINKHLQTVEWELENETDERCRMLQEDYVRLIRRIGSREAITRRFFIIFEYEPWNGSRKGDDEAEAVAELETATRTAANYLRQCGNDVLAWEDEDEFTTDVLYNLLNRRTSAERPLAVHAKDIYTRYLESEHPDDAENIPANEFFAPESIDFTEGGHIKMDGVFYAYLLIPSGGYKPRVMAGWLSLLINSGEGIDVDLFMSRQPKERIVQKLGQQLRINRSKIKDASDTNTDFDDLDGAIRGGYYLKDGLASNEDFYYINIMVTVTADSRKELEWRVNEMKKLLLSQDMNVVTCTFREEQAFLSSLPLNTIEKKLYQRSKRNILTSGAASCYPFTSYEMCDEAGILLGVNKHNASLIIVDIFNSKTYKNANMAILGTSGGATCYGLKRTM